MLRTATMGGRTFSGWRIEGGLDVVVDNGEWILYPRDDFSLYQMYKFVDLVEGFALVG